MSTIYPNATFMAADPTNYSKGRWTPAGQAAVSLIVIHITSGRGHALPVVQMWQTPHNGSSAHFVIDQDGTVYQVIDCDNRAYHAHSANVYSVGIEHCAREPNEPSFPKGDPGLPVSEDQYASSAKLVAWLLKKYGLSCDRDHVKGHCEADTTTTHTGCPNSIWDWDHYMDLVKDEYLKLP